MANEFHGQKMSDYADIDSAQLTQEEKDYYREHALVTTFGKTDGDASTGNSNYNVKLSDISKNALPPVAADDKGKVLTVGDSESLVWGEVSGAQPNYGVGLSYDADTNTLSVKAGKGIGVNDNGGVNIKTQDAKDGDVLTYNATADDVVWATPAGGGGLPDLSKLIGQTAEWKGYTESDKKITLFCDIKTDESGKIVTANNLRWGVNLTLDSGSSYYF